jgi:lipoyl(octanoyl) transferase
LVNHYRLIISPAASGAFNMALDEAFLIQASQKVSPPTLRLYSWDPPALSLGFAQKTSDVDLAELKKRGWDLVRRPTGGKAILHIDELTYSITAPVDDPLVNGTLLESYQRISSILQKALADLGVKTLADQQYPNSPETSKTNPICFEVPSNFEITFNYQKLIGSAQARKNGGVLQHGSLPLSGDLSRISQVLNYASEDDRCLAAQKVLSRAITLSDAADKTIPWQTAADSIIHAFYSQMDIRFKQSEPTSGEVALADELICTKYGTTAWNFRL